MALKYPAALLFALLLAGSAVGQTSPFNYVSFDFPGAMHTQGKGINASGEIVGLYTNDPNCFLSAWPATDCQTHGFKRVNGKYSTIDVPRALSTAALGVNAYGDIVGFYIKSDNTVMVSSGYIRATHSAPWTIRELAPAARHWSPYRSRQWLWLARERNLKNTLFPVSNVVLRLATLSSMAGVLWARSS